MPVFVTVLVKPLSHVTYIKTDPFYPQGYTNYPMYSVSTSHDSYVFGRFFGPAIAIASYRLIAACMHGAVIQLNYCQVQSRLFVLRHACTLLYSSKFAFLYIVIYTGRSIGNFLLEDYKRPLLPLKKPRRLILLGFQLGQ